MQGEPEEEDVPVRTRSCGYSEKVGYSSLKIPPPFLKNTPKNKIIKFFFLNNICITFYFTG